LPLIAIAPRPPRPAIALRPRRRAAALLLTATLAFGSIALASTAAAPAASAATTPTVTATAVPQGGGSVTLTGSGFLGAAPGIYLGIGPQALGDFYTGSDSLIASETTWIAVGNADATTGAGRTAPMTTAGTFTLTVTVPAGTDTSFAVYTSKAHGTGVSDPSQNTVTSLGYASAPTNPTDPTDPTNPTNPTNPTDPTDPTTPTDPTGPSTPAPATQRLRVSTVSAEGYVTVTGTGYSPKAPGIYVGLARPGYSSLYSASAAGSALVSQTTWVARSSTLVSSAASGIVTASGRTAVLSSKGAFSLRLKVPANGKRYAVYTSLADGAGKTNPAQNASATLTRAAVTTSAAAAAQPKCLASEVTSSTLNWAIKDSFRTYIRGSIAGGSWSLASIGDTGGRFVWSNGTGSVNTSSTLGYVSYPGTLKFTGHDGALDITITGIGVRYDSPRSATVIASFNTLGLDGKRTVMSNIAFATVALPGTTASGSTISVTNAPTTLTKAGATAFGDFYSVGQAMAPLSTTLALGGTVACTSLTSAALAETGVDASGPTLAALLMLLGGASVLTVARLRRRRAEANPE
jgi:hypothetical protein